MRPMRLFLLLCISIILASCSKQQQEWDSVSFPLYSQCDHLLKTLDSNLSANSETYEYQITKEKFDAAPPYGDIPYGTGTVKVRGDLKLLNGTPEEYLSLHVKSIFSDCMPNNSVAIGGQDVASEIERTSGGTIISGKVENGRFYILINDGSYSYE